MICFLTSRTDDPYSGRLNRANRFVDELRASLPARCRALFLCSDPEAHEKTDYYAKKHQAWFEEEGFSFERFSVLDGRNEARAAEYVRSSVLLILAGGHVPTQNRFFQKIGLRGLLRDYRGVVVGISAGSMNSAETVYAQPEEPGEAVDPAYRRFLPGLGLTKTMLLPHYQDTKDLYIDGMRLFEDVTYPDSVGRSFYAIPDGSYLFCAHNKEELRGEAYLIKDGAAAKISENGGTYMLNGD